MMQQKYKSPFITGGKARAIKNLTLLLIIFLGMAAEGLFAQSKQKEREELFYQVSARLLVKDRDASGRNIARWAEERGGYYTQKSLDTLIFRLPSKELAKLKTMLEAESSEILDYAQSAENLKEAFLMTQSALNAREELLQKNLSYLDRSDFQGTLSIEKEIRRLGNEIDSLKGQLRFLENNKRFARIELNLSFRNQSVPQDRPSRFDWINHVNFYRFMESPSRGALWALGTAKLPVPDGFALASRRPFFQALSPEGVKIRLKETKNYPKQSLDFWMKALNGRLSNRGYIPLSPTAEFYADKNQDKNQPFLMSRWGLPYGNQNYIYLTGLRLKGKKLQILEIAGPAAYVEYYFPR